MEKVIITKVQGGYICEWTAEGEQYIRQTLDEVLDFVRAVFNKNIPPPI